MQNTVNIPARDFLSKYMALFKEQQFCMQKKYIMENRNYSYHLVLMPQRISFVNMHLKHLELNIEETI